MSAPHELSPEAYRAYRATQEAATLTEAAIATGQLVDALKADLAVAREELRQAHAREARLREALEFYAAPETYFAIGFFPDPPNGEFMNDFEPWELGADKPGKRARAALAERGDNPVVDIVEAARRDITNAKIQCGGDGQGCEAFRPSYKPPRVWAKCGRCPMGALFETIEALARLDESAEEKG